MKKWAVISTLFFTIQPQILVATDFGDSIRHYNNLALDYYYASELDTAETLFLKTLYFVESSSRTNRIDLADTYNNLGLVYTRMWNYGKAMDYLKKSVDLYISEESYVAAANAYSNLGKVYRMSGNYEQALLYYNNALIILENENTDIALQRKAEVLNRCAIMAYEQNNYNQSISLIRKALYEYSRANKPNKLTTHSLYITIAEGYSKLKLHDSASFYHIKSLQNIESGHKYSTYRRVYTYQRMAENYLEQGELKKALNAINTTEAIFSSSSTDSIFHTRILVQKARYYELSNNYSEAITCYNQANEFYLKRSRMVSKSNYASSTEAITLLKKRALCYQMWFYQTNNIALLDTTLAELKKISELIDLTRKSYLGIESKLRLTEAENGIYNIGINCSYSLYAHTGNAQYLNEAFYFTSKSKSAVLLENLNELNAKQFAGIPAHLFNEEKELKQQQAYLKHAQYRELSKATPNTQQLDKLQNKLFENLQKQQNFNHIIENTYPAYNERKNKQTNLSIEDLQQRLKRNETLLEYQLTDSTLFVHRIDKHTHELYRTAIDSLFYSRLDNFIAQHTTFDFKYLGTNVFKEYAHLANELYCYLFPAEMRGNLKKQLIIVPDSKISYLPFESLVCSKEHEVKSFAGLDYLFQHHELSYAYSSLLPKSSIQRKKQLNNKLLAIAPEYHSEQYNNERNPRRNILTPLPYAKKEVRLIAGIMQGDTAIGPLANSDYFKQEAGNYDVLHLAMHTSIDNEHPLYSKFLFSNEPSDFLNTGDIFMLDLNAGLSVLSACNTGDGIYKNGEGIMSLSRGFAYAGCPSTILTLWQVEDKAAMKVMDFFYRNMRKGYSKSKALDRAKKKYLQTADETALHPFFWSAYILIGEKTPLYYNRRGIAALLISITIAGTLFWLLKRRVQ